MKKRRKKRKTRVKGPMFGLPNPFANIKRKKKG
jgi:hypothetical protein